MATIYQNYTGTQLFSLFRAENWHSPHMSDTQRQQALQELASRDAAANGTRQYPVELSQTTRPFGAYQGGKGIISLNEAFVNRGMNEVDPNAVRPISAANLRAMDTIFHENEHVRQHEMVAKPIWECSDPQMHRDLTANFHGFNYIQPDYDFSLYRIQICEKCANEAACAKVTAAMDAVAAERGGQNDPNMMFYRGCADRSYQLFLEDARTKYNDPHVEQTLQRAMNDNTFFNRMIPEDQNDAYYRIRSIMANQEIDACRKHLDENPELDESFRHRFESVIAARAHELDDLKAANAMSRFNAHRNSAANSAAAGHQTQNNPAGKFLSDGQSSSNGNSQGM